MIRTYSKDQLDAMIASGLTGPQGPPGVGVPAYTTTSAGFTQPASGANVTASVGDTSWMSPGQELYVATGGYYAVSSITNATTVVLTNSGYPVNASPGATINSGSKVSPGGIQGPAGGATNLDSLSDVAISSPSTGQVVKYNGTTWVNDTDATGGGSAQPFPDNTALVKNNTDATKLIRVDAATVATGTTRVLTMPNADVNLTADQAAANASPRSLGTSSTSAAAGNDSRFSTRTESVFETHIAGLQLTWNTPGNNGNLLTVSSGSAWIPSLGRVYNVPSTITGPTQTLTASSWHYIYLYDNAGTPAIEISTTAPAAPYKGTARNKTSDPSRRLIGALRTGSGGTPAMSQFISMGEAIIYTALATRVVDTVGPGLTNQNPNISAAAPPGITTEVLVQVQAGTGGTAGLAYIEWMLQSGGSRVGLVGAYIAAAGQFAFTTAWLPVLPATPSIFYNTVGPAGSAFYVDLAGYRITR